ncbi:MAG: hypothetical protein ACODAU_00340 [Myxococcota bacterium]
MADTRKVLIIAGAGCGVLLLATCCFAGAGFYYCRAAWTDTEGAAQSFLADLREDRVQSAYGRMTPRYRQTHDLAEFRRTVTRSPGLTTHERAEVTQHHFEPGRARLGGVLHAPEGSIPFRIVLERDDEGWRVDSVTVEPREPDGQGADEPPSPSAPEPPPFPTDPQPDPQP